MSDMRASAAAEVAADLIRSAATLWAKRATILDGVTQQADRAEVRAAEAAASAETAAGHDASAAARASEAAASRDAADESAGNAAASRDAVAADAAIASSSAADAAAAAEAAATMAGAAAASASEASAGKAAAAASAGDSATSAATATSRAADAAASATSATASASAASASAEAAAWTATQAATSATGAAASAATASARAGEAATSRDEAAASAASAAIAAGLSYSMTIYNTAGVPSGIYYLCRATHTAGTHGRLHAEVISGSAGASISFRVLVNGVPATGLRTVVLGTPLALAGLALAIPAGARIDVEIDDAPGVTEFFMEIAR